MAVHRGPRLRRDPQPVDPEHTPGGSSGGSAAAVAAGLVPAALGSDGAGSVRIPAAWTHLVGIKPQRGRISTWPRRRSPSTASPCNGPLARTVADAALLLDAATGNHPGTRTARRAGRCRSRRSAATPAGCASPSRPEAAVHRAPARLQPGVRARSSDRREAGRLGPRRSVEARSAGTGRSGSPFLPRATAGIAEWVRVAPFPVLPRRPHPAARPAPAAARRGPRCGGAARRGVAAPPGSAGSSALRRRPRPDDGRSPAADRGDAGAVRAGRPTGR